MSVINEIDGDPEIPSGIYIARLLVPPTAGVPPEYSKSIKMLILKEGKVKMEVMSSNHKDDEALSYLCLGG